MTEKDAENIINAGQAMLALKGVAELKNVTFSIALKPDKVQVKYRNRVLYTVKRPEELYKKISTCKGGDKSSK